MIPRWPTRRPRSGRPTPVYSSISATTLRRAATALRDGSTPAYGAQERRLLATALEQAAARAESGQIVTVGGQGAWSPTGRSSCWSPRT